MIPDIPPPSLFEIIVWWLCILGIAGAFGVVMYFAFVCISCP